MISVHILTKNSGDTIAETLQSLVAFSEVVIYDNGSTDKTIEICEQFKNVKVHHGPFQGFGPMHNAAAAVGSNDWVLAIDSDEVVSRELADEILQLKLDPQCVYAIERDNYLNGKKIRFCAGWHPDWVIRLYHRKSTRFTDDQVHEKVITKNLRVLKLQNTIKHVPYRSMSDFLDKMQKYSTLFARQHQGKKESSVGKALVHGVVAFCKNYFLKRGFLGGREGYILSVYNAQTTYYKYLKLAELNKKL